MIDPHSKADSWKLFDRIASRYDRLNQILSFGMSLGWRRSMVECLPDRAGLEILDVATGTADIPLILLRSRPDIKKIIGVDLSQEMLSVGRRKLAKVDRSSRVELKAGDGQDLPFDDSTFDVVTVVFGLRNFPDFMKGITEAYRVLRVARSLFWNCPGRKFSLFARCTGSTCGIWSRWRALSFAET
jgi:demethylmenaquinone methyltransferase/2-methoxy-6-polyprenyl-1,4-benzoquinol methylase